MFSHKTSRAARNPVPSFLLGAGCATILFLSFAGAGLALAGRGFEAPKTGLNELRLNRVPPSAFVSGNLA